jgi:hypothetical protein
LRAAGLLGFDSTGRGGLADICRINNFYVLTPTTPLGDGKAPALFLCECAIASGLLSVFLPFVVVLTDPFSDGLFSGLFSDVFSDLFSGLFSPD